MFRRQPTFDAGWHWRHEITPPKGPPRFGDAEADLDKVWRELVLIHTTFRATDQREYGQIVRGLRDIEQVFLDRPKLNDYYEECHRRPGDITVVVRDPNEPAPVTDLLSENHRHIAAIQARFMEDVYFVLQLSRFANALDNRGWMNLFRSWGQSARFNAVWNTMVPTFTEEFVEFYNLYVRYYPGPIELFPVPHPWDHSDTRKDPRPFAEDRYADVLPGVFLDSGIREAGVAGDVRGAPLPSPGSESHGVKDEESRTMSSKDNWSVYGENPERSGEGGGPNK